MIYQFFNGETPFKDLTAYLTIKNILNKPIDYSVNNNNNYCVNLLENS